MENRVTKREMYEALVSFAVNGEMSYETEEGAVVVSMDELKVLLIQFFLNKKEYTYGLQKSKRTRSS